MGVDKERSDDNPFGDRSEEHGSSGLVWVSVDTCDRTVDVGVEGVGN